MAKPLIRGPTRQFTKHQRTLKKQCLSTAATYLFSVLWAFGPGCGTSKAIHPGQRRRHDTTINRY